MFQLIIITLLVFPNSIGVEIDLPPCKESKAFNIKCFDKQNEDVTNGGTVTRDNEILVQTEMIPGACPNAKNRWSVIFIPPSSTDNSFDTAQNGTIYETERFSVGPYSIKNVGKVTLKVFLVGFKSVLADPEICELNVAYSRPLVTLEGGTRKHYVMNKDTSIIAKASDLNNKDGDPKNLSFRWSCSVKEGPSSPSCQSSYMEKFKNKRTLVIPNKDARKENVYLITLTVAIKDDPNFDTTVKQKVYFDVNKLTQLSVKCAKNCKPKSSATVPTMPTILKAICENCLLGGTNYLYWTILDANEEESVDYAKLKNRRGDVFYLRSGALEKKKDYIARVGLINNGKTVLSAEIELFVRMPPPVKNCSVDPPKGVAFQTGFEVKCVFVPNRYTFQLFGIKNETANLLVQSTDLKDLIMLPADVSIVLNATDQQTGYTQSIELDVVVEKRLNLSGAVPDSEINRAVGDVIKEAADLIKDGHPELALQGLVAVVQEYSTLPPQKQETVKSLDLQTINTLKSIKLNNPVMAQQMADIVSQINTRYNESDPDLAAQTTPLCDKASEVLTKRPSNAQSQITQTIKSLAGCSQSSLLTNPKAIETFIVPVNITSTKHPLITGKIPTENYPDYMDDEQWGANAALFEKSTRSLKKICFSNSKMLAAMMIPEEDSIVITKKSLIVIGDRIYCYEKNHRQMLTEVLSIQLSTACLSKMSIVDILCCYTYENPYWYIDDISQITPFAFVKFTENKSELSGPFQITLTIRDGTKKQFKLHQATLPDESIHQIGEDGFYEKSSIHRIFVPKNFGFSVKFENMSENDKYDMVLTHFEKPTFEYFKANHRSITFNSNILEIRKTHGYDGFWFLSVLSNKGTKSYSFSSTITGCYTWNDTSRRWEFSCYSKTGIFISNDITCYCQSGYVFTGFVRNNKVNLETASLLEFALELRFCWIVYAVVMTTYLVFGIILFLTSFEKPHDILDKVFFLGDIPSSYRYTYLIIIGAGKKWCSGTTSNVTVKLSGSNGSSLEHVLNYPDPELVMLQRHDETWFILATDCNLGEIENIEIWFDSLGNNSKWYCSRIEIHDIQIDRYWLFKVDKWFDLMQQEQIKYSFKPTDGTLLTRTDSLKCKMDNEVNMWNLFIAHPLLMRKERALLILSSVILMYLLIMTMYFIPSFSETDMIDAYSLGFHYSLLWSPILGSLATFIIHFPLIHFIKRDHIPLLKSKRLYKISGGTVATLCWVIIIFNTTFTTTALIVSGFWMPFNTSLLWLASVVLGILFHIVVLQRISSVVNDHFIKLSGQVEAFKSTLKRVIQYVELQRVWIYKRFGAFGLRPYLTHLYLPLDYLTKKERYKWEETKRKVESILKDLALITLYVSLLYIILIIDKHPQTVNNCNEIKKLVLGEMTDDKEEAKSISTLKNFVSATLIPSIQAIHWYGKFLQDNPGMMKDFSNRYLGIVRLRQHRTKNKPCDLPKEIRLFNMTCRLDFSILKDTKDYSKGWKPATDISSNTTERMGNVWKYTDSSITGTSAYLGEYGFYPGGGYVAPLGRSMKNSLISMKYLDKHGWLDARTRALFVELLAYNPNTNLFSSVSLIFEYTAVGNLMGNVLVKTRKFLMVDKNKIFTINAINICFVLMIFALIIRITYKIIKERAQYFYDLWSIFDIVIVLLSIISIFFYYIRLGRIFDYISEVSKAKNNQFVNYFHLFNTDNTLTALMAVLVFVSTLRLWKLLKFMVIIKIAEKTISDSLKPLSICVTYQMLYMIAFSLVGVLLFSARSKEFKDFRSSFITLLLFSLGLVGDFNYDDLRPHFVGITFYGLYMMFSLFFFTVYVAIINIYYAEATDHYADEEGIVQKYIGEKWIYYKTLLKVRARNLRGGEDLYENLVIKPKSTNRYEDCMTIPKTRLKSMALVTICVLRNLEGRQNLEDDDFKLMSRTIKAMFGEESPEKEVFFATTTSSRGTEFVDDRRIEQIADICERLARECKEVSKISRQQQTFINKRIERINNLTNNIKNINKILHNIKVQPSN